MGYLDAGNQGGLLGPLPDNRLLGAQDYANVQPGYAPPGPLNAGPIHDAATAFATGMANAPAAYLQQHQDFLDGIDPNTGQPAVTPYDRLNTLAHFVTNNMGPQSVGGTVAPVEGAFGAGPIRAYHGSPHSFDAFDLGKIGTGEGAQAYGRGLYFAENEDVARGYRDSLTGNSLSTSAGNLPLRNFDGPQMYAADAVMSARGDYAEAARRISDMPGLDAATRDGALASLDELKRSNAKPAGSMYEVNLHADPASLLDWHKPLGQQSQQIQDVVAQLGAQHGFTVGPQGAGYLAYQRLRDAGVIDTSTATDAARASQSLLEAGVPGIQYRDGLSRTIGTGTLDKQKTSNYVMFDPKRIEILRKYGLLGPAAVGAGLLGGEQQ